MWEDDILEEEKKKNKKKSPPTQFSPPQNQRFLGGFLNFFSNSDKSEKGKN